MIAARVKEAVRTYRGLLEQLLPGRVRRVVLFGSWARGETHLSLPVKVLVLVSDATSQERLYALALSRDLMTDLDPSLTMDPTVLSIPQWNELERRQGYFVREVARDGVDVSGEAHAATDDGVAAGGRRNTA